MGVRDELIGTHSNGTPIRLELQRRTPDSFRWVGQALNPDSSIWKLETEFHAKRR